MKLRKQLQANNANLNDKRYILKESFVQKGTKVNIQREGGNSHRRPGIYMCLPWVIGKIKNIVLVIGKNKKKIGHFPLKRVKFEIFARVIG